MLDHFQGRGVVIFLLGVASLLLFDNDLSAPPVEHRILLTCLCSPSVVCVCVCVCIVGICTICVLPLCIVGICAVMYVFVGVTMDTYYYITVPLKSPGNKACSLQHTSH